MFEACFSGHNNIWGYKKLLGKPRIPIVATGPAWVFRVKWKNYFPHA